MKNSEPETPLMPRPLIATPELTAPWVLVGSLGLRAGWGICLYLLLALFLEVGLNAGVLRVTGQLNAFQRQSQEARVAAAQAKATGVRAPTRPMQPTLTGLSELVQTGAVLLAALTLSFLERRRFGVYGLGSGRIRDVLSGAGWGFLAMALLILALRGFHLLVFDAQVLSGGLAVRFGAEWLLIFAFVGASEECLFRGYLQFTLMRGLLTAARRIAPEHERGVAFALSATVWSGLFFVAHIHNAGESVTGLAAVFLAGVVFSYALWRTGSLWWGVGAHLTWDWAQSFLFGVPDSGTLSAGRLFQTHAVGPAWLSGGADGPEGSVLVIPALLLLCLAIRLQRAGTQPPVEPEQREVPSGATEAVPGGGAGGAFA